MKGGWRYRTGRDSRPRELRLGVGLLDGRLQPARPRVTPLLRAHRSRGPLPAGRRLAGLQVGTLMSRARATLTPPWAAGARGRGTRGQPLAGGWRSTVRVVRKHTHTQIHTHSHTLTRISTHAHTYIGKHRANFLIGAQTHSDRCKHTQPEHAKNKCIQAYGQSKFPNSNTKYPTHTNISARIYQQKIVAVKVKRQMS